MEDAGRNCARAALVGEEGPNTGRAPRKPAAKRASAATARCPKDGTLAAPGTKFCPEGGTRIERAQPGLCLKCGAQTGTAKFCPECGTKLS